MSTGSKAVAIVALLLINPWFIVHLCLVLVMVCMCLSAVHYDISYLVPKSKQVQFLYNKKVWLHARIEFLTYFMLSRSGWAQCFFTPFFLASFFTFPLFLVSFFPSSFTLSLSVFVALPQLLPSVWFSSSSCFLSKGMQGIVRLVDRLASAQCPGDLLRSCVFDPTPTDKRRGWGWSLLPLF